MTALLLAAILSVLVWICLQVNKLVEILSFLSIQWQKHVTHDLLEDGGDDDKDE